MIQGLLSELVTAVSSLITSDGFISGGNGNEMREGAEESSRIAGGGGEEACVRMSHLR